MVRKPEKGTGPKIFYLGADESGDPAGDRGAAVHVPGRPGAPAAARLARSQDPQRPATPRVDYDVPHSKPWGFDLVLYLLIKGISTGAMFLSALLWLLGDRSSLVGLGGPLVSRVLRDRHGGRPGRSISSGRSGSTTSSRGRTGVVAGARRVPPDRRTARSPRSGSSAGWFGLDGRCSSGSRRSRSSSRSARRPTPGFLFAQGLARDLWQGPHATIDLIAQAAAEGSAALLLAALVVGGDAGDDSPLLALTLAVAAARAPRHPAVRARAVRRARRGITSSRCARSAAAPTRRLFWGGAIGRGGLAAARALVWLAAARLSLAVARRRPRSSRSPAASRGNTSGWKRDSRCRSCQCRWQNAEVREPELGHRHSTCML